MTHLEKYLQDLRDAWRTGEAVKETSFYPALSNLLNAVGARLKPKVSVVINPKNRGAGLPDGGLFTAGQLKKLGGDTAAWTNVPARVWEYTVGGYQVLKKWLSYREHDILGRSLTVEEAREVTQTARRIAALLLLEPALDANYERVKASPYDWAAGR